MEMLVNIINNGKTPSKYDKNIDIKFLGQWLLDQKRKYKNNEIVCCSPYVDYRESIHLFKKHFNLSCFIKNEYSSIS